MDDDFKLVTRLQQGEESAWREVVEQFYQQLLLFCGRYVPSQTEAKDLVQDTFVKAMNNIAKFNTRGYSSLKPWLWQIAKNTALNYLKSKKFRGDQWQSIQISDSTTSQTFLRIPDINPGPRTELEKSFRYKLVLECLDSMEQKFSEILLLHYMDGFTRREIAELLGIPENTVKSRLRLALEKVRLGLPDSLAQ